jgi:hypothetical protein
MREPHRAALSRAPDLPAPTAHGRARLLPWLGVFLFGLPLLWRSGRRPVGLLYLFAAWDVLIVLSVALVAAALAGRAPRRGRPRRLSPCRASTSSSAPACFMWSSCSSWPSRPKSAARRGQTALAAFAARLHAVAVGLLHRLDLLRRGGLRGAVGARVRDDLPRSHARDDRLVRHPAQARARSGGRSASPPSRTSSRRATASRRCWASSSPCSASPRARPTSRSSSSPSRSPSAPSRPRRATGGVAGSLDPTAVWVAAGLALFTIIFGTRNLDVDEKHNGVVMAIAVEAVVKLVALIAVGVFVMFRGGRAGADARHDRGLAHRRLAARGRPLDRAHLRLGRGLHLPAADVPRAGGREHRRTPPR